MITAVKQLAESWWKPEEGEETEFLLSPLSQIDYIAAMNLGKSKFIEGSGFAFLPDRDGIQFILSKGLRGWKNFKYEDGSDVEFTIKNIDMVPAEYLGMIVAEILQRSSIRPELKKSSE